VLNFGAATSGQTIETDIVDNDFIANTLRLGEGLRIGNFQGATGSIVNARMSGNRSWGQKQGRLIVNNRAISSSIKVIASGNRFYGNGAGTIIVGGLSSNNTRADGNTIDFESHGEHFIDNTGESEFDLGGLFILGVEDNSEAGGGTGNTVNVALWGARMLDNSITDLGGIGARSLSEQTAVFSQNNHVTIEIHGGDKGNGNWQAVEYFTDNVPESQKYGNSVTVIRY
jgi:hypothetical protein